MRAWSRSRVLIASVPLWLTIPSVPHGESRPPNADDPWEAAERLGAVPSLAARPGPRFEVGMESWEAMPGAWEGAVRLSYQREGGVGFLAGWRRFHSGNELVVDDISVGGILRFRRARVVLEVGEQRHRAERVRRIGARGEIQPLSSLVTGLRARVHPGEPAAAPEILASAYGSRSSWLVGIELGPGPGQLRVAVGIRVGKGLVWTLAYADANPSVGLAWRLWILELRAGSTRHPILGAVAQLDLVAGALTP